MTATDETAGMTAADATAGVNRPGPLRLYASGRLPDPARDHGPKPDLRR